MNAGIVEAVAAALRDTGVDQSRKLLLEAAWYIRDAAICEPEEGLSTEDTGHGLADKIFDFLGVDRSGEEHRHVRDPL